MRLLFFCVAALGIAVVTGVAVAIAETVANRVIFFAVNLGAATVAVPGLLAAVVAVGAGVIVAAVAVAAVALAVSATAATTATFFETIVTATVVASVVIAAAIVLVTPVHVFAVIAAIAVRSAKLDQDIKI